LEGEGKVKREKKRERKMNTKCRIRKVGIQVLETGTIPTREQLCSFEETSQNLEVFSTLKYSSHSTKKLEPLRYPQKFHHQKGKGEKSCVEAAEGKIQVTTKEENYIHTRELITWIPTGYIVSTFIYSAWNT